MNDKSTYFGGDLTRNLYNGTNIVLTLLTNHRTEFAFFTAVTYWYLKGLNMTQLLQ